MAASCALGHVSTHVGKALQGGHGEGEDRSGIVNWKSHHAMAALEGLPYLTLNRREALIEGCLELLYGIAFLARGLAA
jgi:hypothetical protein